MLDEDVERGRKRERRKEQKREKEKEDGGMRIFASLVRKYESPIFYFSVFRVSLRLDDNGNTSVGFHEVFATALEHKKVRVGLCVPSKGPANLSPGRKQVRQVIRGRFL